VLSENDMISVLNGRPGLKGRELAANSAGNAQGGAATLGKLAGVSTRLNLFEPLKWTMIRRER
jgi:hypothetical protein